MTAGYTQGVCIESLTAGVAQGSRYESSKGLQIALFHTKFLFCIKKRSLWKKCNVSSGDLLKSDIDTMVKIFFPENNFCLV